MSFKEWWTGIKEKPTPPPGAEPTKIGFAGRELHVNPSEEIALERLVARWTMVRTLLKTKFPRGHPRHKKMARTKRRLEMQIKLKKGDY